MKTTIKKLLMSTGFLSVATTLLLIGCGGQTEEEIFEKILTKHLSDKGGKRAAFRLNSGDITFLLGRVGVVVAVFALTLVSDWVYVFHDISSL